jgi:hypothetical protein
MTNDQYIQRIKYYIVATYMLTNYVFWMYLINHMLNRMAGTFKTYACAMMLVILLSITPPHQELKDSQSQGQTGFVEKGWRLIEQHSSAIWERLSTWCSQLKVKHDKIHKRSMDRPGLLNGSTLFGIAPFTSLGQRPFQYKSPMVRRVHKHRRICTESLNSAFGPIVNCIKLYPQTLLQTFLKETPWKIHCRVFHHTNQMDSSSSPSWPVQKHLE